MSVINTNITSVIAQKNLTSSKSALTTAMERLSSGMRINSAKDDAAGQAIANRMTAQVKGLAQAQRNANDGISVAQTAEGALNQVNDNLQRVRELAVQAQNGTNSADDLSSIQSEVTQRLSEIDRISKETDFNGVKVLGETKALNIQVGANDGETIAVSLKTMDSAALGVDNLDLSKAAQPELTEDMKIAYSSTLGDVYKLSGGEYAAKDEDGNLIAVQISDNGGSPLAETDGDAFVAITYTNEDGDSVNATYVNSGAGVALAGKAEDGKYYAVGNVDADTGVSTDDWSDGIDGAAVTTSAGVLKQLDNALKLVDDQRSALGAVQNRFESAITNLSTNETNLTSARSRIQDADYAVEVANMTRAQILQQAGTSVLSQANQLPQGVLSLLR